MRTLHEIDRLLFPLFDTNIFEDPDELSFPGACIG
jgi:hypothetical protein